MITEDEAFRILYPTVFPYTVPIKQKATTQDDEMGAGVLIDIAGRLFIASARHVIRDDPAVLEDHFTFGERGSVKILRRGLHKTLDIGFLELERNKAIPILNRGECSLHMLTVQQLPVGEMIHIVGFPAVARTQNRNYLKIAKKGFGTKSIGGDTDSLYFLYPKEGYAWDVQSQEWEQAPFDANPTGYSGGGVWGFRRQPQGELITPQSATRLIAIQSAWHETERYVKAVPIAHWLRVVCDYCPELQQVITSQFPTLTLEEDQSAP